MIIGIDFDNTIIDYHGLFYTCAKKMGYLSEETDIAASADKGTIRDYIRGLADGEIKWQKLQAQVYGPEIKKANLMDGFLSFLSSRLLQDDTIYIISHKSVNPAQDKRINLRQAAIDWMRSQNLIDRYLSYRHLFFESTRKEKIARISQMNCDYFIDDLAEIFTDDDFPSQIGKVILTQRADRSLDPSIRQFDSWKKITKYIDGYKTAHAIYPCL